MSLRDELNGYLRLPRNFFGIPRPKTGLPDVGILGVPYDITSSYKPGSRFGPDAIRAATDGERAHSFPLNSSSSPVLGGDSLTKVLTIEDIGDLEVMGRLPESALNDIYNAAAKLAPKGTFLLFLGGDHFITYPLMKGVKKGRPGKYGLLYFDAHADFYKDYGGYSLSHATTLRRIIEEEHVRREDVIVVDGRSALPEQREQLAVYESSDIDQFRKAIDELTERVDVIYISVDLDVLSPHLVPGVSHPESGGPTALELASLLRICFQSRKVQYADIVELNPLADKSQVSLITVRDVLKELLTGFAVQKDLK
ncbi:MAG: arginase family protein [Candidatus Hodarchaeota archaeon]